MRLANLESTDYKRCGLSWVWAHSFRTLSVYYRAHLNREIVGLIILLFSRLFLSKFTSFLSCWRFPMQPIFARTRFVEFINILPRTTTSTYRGHARHAAPIFYLIARQIDKTFLNRKETDSFAISYYTFMKLIAHFKI